MVKKCLQSSNQRRTSLGSKQLVWTEESRGRDILNSTNGRLVSLPLLQGRMIATAWTDHLCCQGGTATLLQCSALLCRMAIPLAPNVSRLGALLPRVRPPDTPDSDVTIRHYEIKKPHSDHGAHHSIHHVLVTVGQASSYKDTRDKKSPIRTR